MNKRLNNIPSNAFEVRLRLYHPLSILAVYPAVLALTASKGIPLLSRCLIFRRFARALSPALFLDKDFRSDPLSALRTTVSDLISLSSGEIDSSDTFANEPLECSARKIFTPRGSRLKIPLSNDIG